MGQPAQAPGETTDQMMSSYLKHFDEYLNKNTSAVLPTEKAMLEARQQIDPAQKELELSLAQKYLPQFTDVGLAQQRQQQMGQAGIDRDVLAGPGKDLVKANLEAQKLADPEFYHQREGTSAAMDKLYGSLDDPNEGLSPAERMEVERSLARTNQQRGIESPTATSAVDAAMNFGQAGATRKAGKQQAINAAVQTAGNVMPSLRSGVDVLQLTTGRPSVANQGLGQMGQNREVGDTSMNLGNQLFSQIGTNARQDADINSKKRTAFQSVMDIGNTMGNMASGFSKV